MGELVKQLLKTCRENRANCGGKSINNRFFFIFLMNFTQGFCGKTNEQLESIFTLLLLSIYHFYHFIKVLSFFTFLSFFGI